MKRWLTGIAELCLLTVLLLCFPGDALWEARATVFVSGAAGDTVPELLESAYFFRHIREISDFSGEILADPIPGTGLVQIRCRDTLQAHAQAGMTAVLDRLPPVVEYFSPDFSMEILLPPTLFEETSPRDFVSRLLFGGLGLLLLVPLPKWRGEWDLWDLLTRFGKFTKRFFPAAMLLSLTVTAGFFLYQSKTYTPVYQASALVSIGEYHPETASLLPDPVQGLLGSDLLTAHLPTGCRLTAAAAGESNLFTFTATGASPADAEAGLDTALAHWPWLSSYASMDLTLTIHETAPASTVPVAPFQPGSTLCKGFLLGLLCWTVLGFAAVLRQNIDTTAAKAYNESQS